MLLVESERLYVLFKLIKVFNESLRIVKTRNSFPRASSRALWITKASAENMAHGEIILYVKTSLL